MKSLRKIFASLLIGEMKKNGDIYLITADLGYNLWDEIKLSYPNRFFNVGASEQLMMGIGIGLALDKKIPIVYSITPFLLYRPAEWIRTYINYENIPVKMVGSGRNMDYAHDGISHWSNDVGDFISLFNNIKTFIPESEEELNTIFNEIIYNGKPSYLNLSTKSAQ